MWTSADRHGSLSGRGLRSAGKRARAFLTAIPTTGDRLAERRPDDHELPISGSAAAIAGTAADGPGGAEGARALAAEVTVELIRAFQGPARGSGASC
jgi:hypothetical protein